MADGAEDGNHSTTSGRHRGLYRTHRFFLIFDMSEPNLPRVDALAVARSLDQKYVTA